MNKFAIAAFLFLAVIVAVVVANDFEDACREACKNTYDSCNNVQGADRTQCKYANQLCDVACLPNTRSNCQKKCAIIEKNCKIAYKFYPKDSRKVFEKACKSASSSCKSVCRNLPSA